MCFFKSACFVVPFTVYSVNNTAGRRSFCVPIRSIHMNYLASHQTFDSKQELNDAVHNHLTSHNLNKTDRDVLLAISRYAVKFPGAAHLKYITLAGIVGKSVPTIRRIIKKLVQLQIIQKKKFIRAVKKGTGANIFTVLPFNDHPEMITRPLTKNADTPTVETEKSEKEPLSSINKKPFNNTYHETFYQRFKKFISSTIGDNTLPPKLYGVYMAHTKRLKDNEVYSSAELEHAGYEALRASVMATKSKTINNLAGYYHGTLDRMLDQLYLSYINKAPSDDGAGAD